jgi:hypothetical protein
MALGILVLITALTISAVAIYYSVAGLVAIFAAAAVPIIIMGGALEVGKLVTAVWLHKYWKQATWWLKTYLTAAVLVLMFITSMGIFGFLSKAHIEQTSAAQEGVANIERIDSELVRQEQIITRAEERIVEAEASVGQGNDALQAQIDKEQGRIDTAYDRIQPGINEQNTIVAAQLNSLEDRVKVYENELKSLDSDLERLQGVVTDYRDELSKTNVASIEEQVDPYNKQIEQLDADLARINTQANEYEARISELNIDTSAVTALEQQIRTIEDNIVLTTNKLQSRERDKIKEGQAVIGVSSDGLFGGNTQRALTAWVTAQQERIATLQGQAVQLRTQAQSALDNERTRLTNLVTDLRGSQTETTQQRKQSLLDAIDSIRAGAIDENKTARADIQLKIDTILNTDIPSNREARTTAQEAITALRQADDPRINAARQAIKDLRASADAQIAASNTLIQRLRDNLTVGKDADVEELVAAQQDKIVTANNTIDTLTEEKYALQAEYRKLEAEVGPVKYLAEFIYGETATENILEEAVRWVILVIIFVFDPLAVLLLIASQYTFEMLKKRKEEEAGESLRLERNSYQRARAQAIVNNPGFSLDPVEDEQPAEENNDTRTEIKEDVGNNDIGTNDQDGSTPTGVAVAREEVITPPEVSEGDDNGTPDQTTNSNIQDDDVEHNERDGKADDEASVLQRSEVEGTEEQVPNSETEQLAIGLEKPYTREDQEKRSADLAEKESKPQHIKDKTAWKRDHPNETLKIYRRAYIEGKIKKLPWEGYKQNDEQSDNSLFSKLRKDED